MKKKIQKRHVQIGEVLAQVETPYRNFNDSSKIFTHFETFSKGTVRNISVVPHKYSFRSNTSIFHTNSYIALS